MVSREEHARRTIAKLEAKLAKAKHPQARQDLEALLSRWRQHLADANSMPSDIAERATHFAATAAVLHSLS
jgi:hypothetical protein